MQIIAVADPAKDLSNYGYSGEKRGGREVGKAIIEAHYGKAEGGGKFAGCNVYENYLDLLEKEDIDAVNVSAPDHWHAHMAIYCARKGKHIYGQKPLALTVEQGRRMADEVKKAGVTWQTGSQQRSDQYFRMAAEFVRNGRLGKLQGITVGLPGGRGDWNQMGSQQEPTTGPGGPRLRSLGRAGAPPRILPGNPAAQLAAQLGLLRRDGHRLGRTPHRHRAVGARHG